MRAKTQKAKQQLPAPGERARKARMREDVFAREYVISLNGQEAATKAGFSAKSAYAAGNRMLKNVRVQTMIAELAKAKTDALDLKAEQVLRELKLLGFSNMLDYIKTNGEGDAFVDLSQLTREQAAAIQEITVEEYTEGRGEDKRDIKKTRFKLAEKRGSLELLGKYLKLFTDKVEHAGSVIQVVRYQKDPDTPEIVTPSKPQLDSSGPATPAARSAQFDRDPETPEVQTTRQPPQNLENYLRAQRDVARSVEPAPAPRSSR